MEALSPPAHRHNSYKAYSDQKLCNILFSCELNKRLSPHGITSNAVHPGTLVTTGLGRNWWLMRLVFILVSPFTKSVQQGAATTVNAAVAEELDGVGGLYFNNCNRSPSSSLSTNPKMASLLWSLSEQCLRDRLLMNEKDSGAAS